MCDHVLHGGVSFLVVKTSQPCLLNNSVCDRVGVMLLQAGCKPQHFAFVVSSKGDYPCDSWRGMCQSACFVKNYGIRLRHSFKELSALDRNALCGTLTHCAYYRYGHCQFQRTRKIYHQYGHCLHCISCEKICQQCCPKTVRHKPVRKG